MLGHILEVAHWQRSAAPLLLLHQHSIQQPILLYHEFTINFDSLLVKQTTGWEI